MKFTPKHFLVFLIVLFIDVVLIIFFVNIFVTSTYIQTNNIIPQNCEENITQTIERIALNLSNHSFTLIKYDCTQFSKSLVEGLNKSNISAYCVSGLYDKFYAHTWVEVLVDNQIYPVEATNGFIIPKEDYENRYIILKKGFCF